MLRITAALLLVTTVSAFAAPPAATCEALNRIVADAPTGFQNLPHHPAKGMPSGIPDPIFPNGAFATLSMDVTAPHPMVFSVTVFHGAERSTRPELIKDQYRDAKAAVTTCLPGVKFLGENDDLEPEATFVATNGTRIAVNYSLGTANVPVVTVAYGFTAPTVAGPGVSTAGTFGTSAPASDASSPETFVRKIYDTYYRRGMEGGLPTTARQSLFSPSLLALTKTNTDRDGGPIIDGDLLSDAQEIDVTAVRVTTISATAKRAVVVAMVTNEGQTNRVTLKLVNLNGTWKIDDVDDLRKRYAAARR